MKTNASDVADFYHQLALLIKARLPLPDSLRQLGRHFPKRDFQKAILEIGESAARGDKFSDVMRHYPEFFDSFHIQLISAGEASGTLPEVLFAVARFARFGQLLTSRVRSILAYPLFTIHMSLIVFTFLSVVIIPEMANMFEEILGRDELPWLTERIVGMSSFVTRYAGVVVPVYVSFLIFSIWLFTPFMAAHRMLLTIINVMPGSCRVIQSLDSARLCTMWSTFLRQNMTVPAAMKTSAQLVERPALSHALLRTAENVESGKSLVEMLSHERAIDNLIVLTFKHTPEQELPNELARLGELYEHRVTLAARAATIFWTIGSLILMSLFVGCVVLSLFLPLIELIKRM